MLDRLFFIFLSSIFLSSGFKRQKNACIGAKTVSILVSPNTECHTAIVTSTKNVAFMVDATC